MIFDVLVVIKIVHVVKLIGAPTIGITAATVSAKGCVISNIAAAMRTRNEGNVAARFPQAAEQTCEHQFNSTIMPTPLSYQASKHTQIDHIPVFATLLVGPFFGLQITWQRSEHRILK